MNWSMIFRGGKIEKEFQSIISTVGGGKGLQKISQAPRGSVKDVEELSFEWRRIEKGRQGKTHSSKPFT